MLETVRKYWIALLVLILVSIHASIVGIIRHQASLAKIDASCEVDLGEYLAYQREGKPALQMRLHAIVPLNHRMKSRQLIELNQAQIRQSLEEYLRQLDSKYLIDPYLADLKSQLLEVMIQTIGDSSIDDLVVTELKQTANATSLDFIAHDRTHQPRKMVATLRAQMAAQDANHGGDEIEEDGHASESASESHGEATHAKPKSSHSEPASKSHGAPAKKAEASGGHGSAAKKGKETKKSGH
jgi:hypothetical protein